MNPSPIQQWIDIIPPETPEVMTLSAVTTFVLVAIILSLLFFTITKRLNLLYSLFNLGKLFVRKKLVWIDNKDLVYELAYILRVGLNQNNLKKCGIYQDDTESWLNFLDHVDQACFAADIPDDSTVILLMNNSSIWLVKAIRIKIINIVRLRTLIPKVNNEPEV